MKVKSIRSASGGKQILNPVSVVARAQFGEGTNATLLVTAFATPFPILRSALLALIG